MSTSDAKRSGRPVFWDSQGIILLDCMEKGKTITDAYYSSLLDCLKTELQEKRPRLATKKSFSITTRISSLLWNYGRKIDGVKVPTSSASPLFSSFGSLGLLLVSQFKEIAGEKEILFLLNEVIAETNAYFAELDQSYYSKGINKLEQRWMKYVSRILFRM